MGGVVVIGGHGIISPTPQSLSQQNSASPRSQLQRFPSAGVVRIHKLVWLSWYLMGYFLDYSTRVHLTVEEDLGAALDGMISGDLVEVEGGGEDIDPMTADIGRLWYIHQQQVKGGRWGGSLLLEEEGVEVPSKINFRNSKFTSTSNPYFTNNGCTHKVIYVLCGKGITNFTPV